MMRAFCASVAGFCLATGFLAAQQAGTATGKGTIERIVPGKAGAGPKRGKGSFTLHYSWAYSEGSGAAASTWIVLTEKEPPVKAWASAKDRADARRAWCEKERTSFVAVKLDSKWAVDLYFLCPANGGLNTEMLS